ncbi:MAG: polysaccharide biosynthesis tyrosine autokinase [Vulcanimicrobiaceae bacterium]
MSNVSLRTPVGSSIGEWQDVPDDAADRWTLHVMPVLKRWKIFLTIFVATFLMGTIASETVPKSYRSTIRLMAGNPSQGQRGQPSDTLPMLNAILAMSGQQSAETYADLLKEAPLAEGVSQRLHLGIDGATLLNAISVTPVTNTAIVSLTAKWKTAEGSAAIANEFGDAFVRQQRALVVAAADEAVGYLREQLPIAESKMHDAQRAQAAFQSRSALVDVNAQTQALVQRLAALDTRFEQTRLEQLNAQETSRRIDQMLRGLSPTMATDRSVVVNPTYQQLVTQRAQVRLQLDTANGQYTREHPVVMALQAQVAELDRQIAHMPSNVVGFSNTGPNRLFQTLSEQRATAQAQATSTRAQLREIDVQRGALRPVIATLPSQTQRLVDLERRTKETQNVYTQLRAKYAEASLERTTVPSNIAFVVRALPRSASVAPSRQTGLLTALALALALAMTGTFLAHFFDRTLTDEADIERELRLPVLTHIATLPKSREDLVVADKAMRVESFLQLIWSLRYASLKPIRSITVVSANPGEGKSTIALHAAAALADAQPGVLLIDADLRRPTLHGLLGHPRALGLSDVLAGLATLESVVHATDRPGLSLLSAGSPVPNPSKLLQSGAFATVLEQARQRFETVIVDTPALNAVFDGAASCVRTDATVLVVAAGVTDLRLIRRALRRLSSLRLENLMGVVLNRAKTPTADYSDYFATALPTQTQLRSND